MTNYPSRSTSTETRTFTEPTQHLPTLTNFDLIRLRQLFRNQVHNEIVKLFLKIQQDYGLSQKSIAKKIDKDPSRIHRLLTDPGNLTLDTISDLMAAMNAKMICRAELFNESLAVLAEPNIRDLLGEQQNPRPWIHARGQVEVMHSNWTERDIAASTTPSTCIAANDDAFDRAAG